MPAKGSASPIRFKLSIGVPVLAFAFLGWFASIFVLQNSLPMSPGMGPSAIPISSMASMFYSPDIGMVSSFLLVWVVGMVAMMFPAMVPVVSMYTELIAKKEGRPRLSRILGSSLFLVGYLSLYALLGLGLFAIVYGVFQVASFLPWLSSLSLIGVASVLVLAGIWQLTPLKEKMLSHCVSPMTFFMAHAKKGFSGALRMGSEHGYYCVGCCWLYMLVMLAVAAMSLLSMVLLSGLIIVEKAFFGGKAWFRWVSAGAFFTLAIIVIAFPSSLALGL